VIELVEGVFVTPEHVALVRKTDQGKCVLYTVGQGALDGHAIPYEAEDVVEAINDALDGYEEEGTENPESGQENG